MVAAGRFGDGDHQIVEHPVRLEMPGVGGGDARHAGEPTQQHAEETGPAHVRVYDFDAAAADFRGHAAQLAGGKRRKSENITSHRIGGQLLGDPGPGRAEERHLVPAPGQLAAQQAQCLAAPLIWVQETISMIRMRSYLATLARSLRDPEAEEIPCQLPGYGHAPQRRRRVLLLPASDVRFRLIGNDLAEMTFAEGRGVEVRMALQELLLLGRVAGYDEPLARIVLAADADEVEFVGRKHLAANAVHHLVIAVAVFAGGIVRDDHVRPEFFRLRMEELLHRGYLFRSLAPEQLGAGPDVAGLGEGRHDGPGRDLFTDSAKALVPRLDGPLVFRLRHANHGDFARPADLAEQPAAKQGFVVLMSNDDKDPLVGGKARGHGQAGTSAGISSHGGLYQRCQAAASPLRSFAALARSFPLSLRERVGVGTANPRSWQAGSTVA